MTTGVRYAAWFVVEARREDAARDRPAAVPASDIVGVKRPPFIGLDTADNAFVDIESVVPAERVLGAAEDLVGRPYELTAS